VVPVVLDARVSPRLSIVAPCYNEEAGLEEFYRRMTAAAQATAGSDYEFVLLNDGSSDRTWAIMPTWCGAIRMSSPSISPAATAISLRSLPASTPSGASVS
jgi:Glycosyltransferases involved in cell wall biogenesis